MKALFILIIALTGFNAFAHEVEEPVALKAPIDDSKDADMIGIKLAKSKKLTYLMRDCPVVGNTESGIYHMPGQTHYQRMLVVNKCAVKGKCKDNRRCFESEAEALSTDYCAKASSCRKYKKSNATLK